MFLNAPGIVFVNSSSDTLLDISTFAQQGCTAAWSFRSTDPDRTRPYLSLYVVPNTSSIQTPSHPRDNQHGAIPPKSDFIETDIRYYERIQLYSKSTPTSPKTGIGKVIKCTAIHLSAGTEAEFDRWYREEHLEQVSRMPGWRKTTRYELISSNRFEDAEVPPHYLAIHEFEEGTEVKRMKKDEWTKWTRRMVDSALKIEEGTFEFVSGLGRVDVGL